MAGAAKTRKTRHGDDAARTAREARRNGARVSTGSQDTTSDADEGDDDESMERQEGSDDDDSAKPVANGKRKRAEEASGDVDGEETEDEESVMESQAEATPSEKNQKKRTEMGVIEEIYCENFMCHRKLRVQLSPHINFITGENGSGKSAIIAAIQICLGASARSTHRGKSIKNLIRHGHDGNALVRITLRNDAEKDGDAFRPKQFGKKIVVERLIRRDGSAEYRLKNEHGVLVSKLKNDLDAMLDHLNIQTENPCAILDQENAKLFLKGNPTDKYKFFLQSTDLYKMRNTYGKIDEETRNMSDSVLRREKVKVSALNDAMQEAVQRWQEAQSIGMLEAEFVQVKKELAWSFVHEKELEAEKVANNLKMKQKDEEQVREEYEEVKKMVQALEDKLKRKTNELEDMNSRTKDIQRRKEEAKNAIRDARRPLHAHNAELKQIRQHRERANARIQRLQRDIETRRRNHDQMIQTRMQRNDEMRERIERKRNEVAHLEREVEEAHQLANPRDFQDGLDQQHEECVRMVRETEHEMSRLENRLSGLRSQKRDSLAVYGNRIPQLQQLIHDNLHRFTSPPIGPLGMYVKLPEHFMHLAVAIEVALKGTLHSYLVVNGKDKALLDELKRRIKCPPNQATIIIAKRSGRRYSNLRVPEGPLGSHAICNILEVNDDEVFNALIDVCSTESKLLFDDKATAEREVLRGVSGSLRMASNYITEVYLKNGDRFMVRKGNLAYIANKKLQRSSVICQDVEGEIADLEKRLDYLRGTYDQLRRDDSRFRHQRDDAVREARRQSERLNELTRRFNQRRVELRSLEDELADDVQQNTLDTSVLEEEVLDTNREVQAFNDREAELLELLSRHNPDLDGLMQVLEDLRTEEGDISAEIAELQEDVDAVYKHLSEVKVQELRFEREASTCGEFVVKWQANLVRLQRECEELSEKAKVVCESDERIEVSHTHDFYGKRLTDIKRKIDQERSRFQGMDLNDLQMDKEEKTLKYTAKKNTYDLFAGNVKMIRTMLDERKRVWHILRKEIAQRTSVEFNKYMNINSFAGKLRFRHDDQRLEIAVLHNDKGVSRKSQVTDMKELSGGERSYTQVSLLLALGESIECPFRVMDEFDVFMDSVNRDMTIQLLVDAAKKDCNKQFIFVTPNDLSALRRDPMVKIQKMDPPRDRLNAEQQA